MVLNYARAQVCQEQLDQTSSLLKQQKLALQEAQNDLSVALEKYEQEVSDSRDVLYSLLNSTEFVVATVSCCKLCHKGGCGLHHVQPLVQPEQQNSASLYV